MNKILEPGRNCQGIYEVETSGLLIDGRNYYRAFYEAALQAKRYILIAGWQFERSVKLLRGRDERQAGGDVRLGMFLNSLCEKKPQLEIFILMWDFSAFVSLDKEWFNKWVLDLMTSSRIYFRFDSKHPVGASHHQKLVVIDGAVAFVGGLDICASSWDDRTHASENPDRFLDGKRFEPYHDVQSFHTGPAAWEMTQVFKRRWIHAGGSDLLLPSPEEGECPRIARFIRIAGRRVAISETRPQTVVPMLKPVRHIRELYRDAIASAEKLIYIENQYFSSQAVYQALKDRMTEQSRPCPQIVLILPKRLHTFVEDVSLSAVQAKMLKSLTEISARHNKPFGVYYTAAAVDQGASEKGTYIHSKLLLVDDRFLTVGSANTTNRSMGMDTELNVSWEASRDEHDLIASIRRARASLLAEHTGIRKASGLRRLASMDGLHEYLNMLADDPGCRLRHHTMGSFLEEAGWIKSLMPDELAIDPESPVIEETLYELISRDRNGVFAKGILFLNELALEQSTEQREAGERHKGEDAAGDSGATIGNLGHRGVLRWYVLAAIGIIAAIVIWLLLTVKS